MPGGEASSKEERAVVYCLVPRELAAKLHEPLRRHFRDDPRVEVVVERRRRERRADDDRRAAEGPAALERRLIRNAPGRRVGERRASLVAVEPRELPRRARRYAERLAFVERLEPDTQHAEDLDTARLVTRFQAGDREAFGALYMRYFDRVYNYLRIALNDPHAAEDATQEIFMKVLETLSGYERRRQPFRAWLFVVVRNYAIGLLQKEGRIEVMDPAELNDRRERELREEPELPVPDWIADRDVVRFVERLPEAQRQVLLLRYMLDLTHAEAARVLGRTPSDVRRLQSRALRFLQQRLVAVGREPPRRDRIGMGRWRKQATVLRRRRTALLGG